MTKIISKFIEHYISRKYKPTASIGIHCHVNADGSYTYNTCALIEKSKSKIDLFDNINIDDDTFIKATVKSIVTTASLVITGSGVIVKRKDANFDLHESLFSVLPQGADPNDFIIQTRKLNDYTELHLCRTELYTSIKRFIDKRIGLEIIDDVIIGPLPCDGYLSSDVSKVSIPNYWLDFKDRRLITYTANNDVKSTPITFCGEKIKPELFLSYFIALRAFLPTHFMSTSLHSQLIAQRNCRLYNLFYKRLTPILFIICLLITLSSITWQNNLQMKLSVREIASTDIVKQIIKIQSKNNTDRERRILHKQLNINAVTSAAILSHKIAENTPYKIRLTKLRLFPKIEINESGNRSFKFEPKSGSIYGEYSDIKDLHAFINILIKSGRISEFHIEHAGLEANSNFSTFRLNFILP